MTPQVHIVLATYNGERYIREQIDSILANTVKDISIEICDDGSADQTVKIAREYAEKHACIHVHENEKNLGYVKNFIAGIRRSRSPYLMLCDQDDIWDPDKIARTLAAMKGLEHECGNDVRRPLLIFTDAVNYDSETGKTLGSFHKNSHLNAEKTDPAHLLMENKCIGCTVMVNAAVLPYLETVPEEVRVHDWWLALICSHFGKICYLNETTLHYRQHRGNMIGGSGFFHYLKNRVSNIKKQRLALEQTFAQGRAFYRLFEKELPSGDCPAAAFARMREAGFLRRRWYVIRYRFYKSGLLRNIALFFLL